jgi:hypothetical protein
MTRWPGAVGAPGGAVAGACCSLREMRCPVGRIPDTGGCGHPLAERIGDGHPVFVQQPPQRDVALGAPAELDDDAARMGRLAEDGDVTAARCTYNTSSRIHAATVSVGHGERDRCRIWAVALEQK